MITKFKDFLMKYRRLFVIITHLILITGAYYFSFYSRFDFNLTEPYLSVFLKTLPLLIVIKFFIFYYFGVFEGLWRYVSMSDLVQILKANALAAVVFIGGEVFLHGLENFPRSVFIIDFIICTGLVAGIRFFCSFIQGKIPVGRFFPKAKKSSNRGSGRSWDFSIKRIS